MGLVDLIGHRIHCNLPTDSISELYPQLASRTRYGIFQWSFSRHLSRLYEPVLYLRPID